MYITKNSLFRKLSIISLAVLVFFTSLLGSTASTANAVGVDTVVKLVGGKAVVRALAEKAGMALSKKQVDNVTGYIEKKTFDGDSKAIEFANKANNLTSSGASEKTGFKKYLLDPASWLLGLDILFLAVDAFQYGYDNAAPVDVFKQCTKPPLTINSVTYTKYYTFTMSNGYDYVVTGAFSKAFVRDTYLILQQNGAGDYHVYGKAPGGSYFTATASNFTDEVTLGSFKPIGLESSNYDCVAPVVPTAEDVVNVSNVNPTVINHFDNDTYNQNTTYNIEIEMPDTPNYDDMVAWNAPDPQIGEALEIGPPPPDSDGDGIPDSEDDSDNDGITDDKDSNADGDGFLENLLGIIAIIALFDLLKAVLFYLARMFDFILTIPLIESVPIDNEAFTWFRTAEIIGIEIYSVVSLLATIGLSFAVYKVVRRLLP